MLKNIKITSPVSIYFDDRHSLIYNADETRALPKALASLLIAEGVASANLHATARWSAPSISLDCTLTLKQLSEDGDGNVHAILTAPAQVKFYSKGGKPTMACFEARESWLAGQAYWLPAAVFTALEMQGAAVRVPFFQKVLHKPLSKAAIDLGWLEHPGTHIDANGIAA